MSNDWTNKAGFVNEHCCNVIVEFQCNSVYPLSVQEGYISVSQICEELKNSLREVFISSIFNSIQGKMVSLETLFVPLEKFR